VVDYWNWSRLFFDRCSLIVSIYPWDIHSCSLKEFALRGFILAFLFAGILLAVVLTVLFILFLLSLFRKKKYNFRIKFS